MGTFHRSGIAGFSLQSPVSEESPCQTEAFIPSDDASSGLSHRHHSANWPIKFRLLQQCSRDALSPLYKPDFHLNVRQIL